MYLASFLLVVLLTYKDAICFVETELESNNLDWDILIFTQHWPLSVCYQWEEKQKKNKCSLPSLSNIWTVHGIWPTKLQTKGPVFCNKSAHFDPDLLSPFEDQLMIYWINIEKNTPIHSFWKHEWVKHGSCAVTLPALNDEVKYFKQALSWIDMYHMQSVLSKIGVTPNATQTYKVETIHDGVKDLIGTSPAIECITDAKTKVKYISEIRICFNKSLDLIDCDVIRDPAVHGDGDFITNCPLQKPLFYPSVVPTPLWQSEFDHEYVPWQLNLYRFLQFLIWFTL